MTMLAFALWPPLALSSPPAEAADRYGAIATGPGGKVGYAYNQYTFDDAQRVAMANCGLPGCALDVWWTGPRCASVAEGADGWVTWAYGSARPDAARMALDACAATDRGCRTLETVCNAQEAESGGRWRTASRSRSVANPASADVVAACARTFDAAADRATCADVSARAGRPMLDAIWQCDAAFERDDHELRCVNAAAGSPNDLRPLVEACAASTSDGEARLACILASFAR